MDPDQKGFITGLRQRFHNNGHSAWEQFEVGTKEGEEPFITGAEELGSDLRTR
jgi:hypothetical protein